MEQMIAAIELCNGTDIILARNKLWPKNKIRCITADVVIQSKGYPVCLNEEIADNLGLSIVDRRRMINADGDVLELDVANNVELRIDNYSTTCRAIILPGNSKPLISRTLFDYLTLPSIRI